MNQIAVLDYRFDQATKDAVQKLASNEVKFWPDRCPEAERVQRTGDAEIVLVTPWEKIDKEYLDACPNIKYLGLCGTSTANIDLNELEKRGIAFTNIVSHSPKVAVAEFFFMLLVQLTRGTDKLQWKPNESHTLTRKTIGIIGLGDVGQGFAQVALGLNMQVKYFSPHRKTEWEEKGVEYQEKAGLLAESDVVVICSSTNVKVMGAVEFEQMKPGGILVQASGGVPFDKPTFFEWVSQEGNYAVFDMSAGEKNYQEYKDLPNVLFSTHVAGDTFESNQRRGQRALENLHQYLDAHLG